MLCLGVNCKKSFSIQMDILKIEDYKKISKDHFYGARSDQNYVKIK